MYLKKIILFIITLFLFTSCYTYRSVGLMQDREMALPKYENGEYKDYRIRVNDEIIYRLITDDQTISKSIQPVLNQNISSTLTYRVMEDGTIDLPFVRSIKVEGLTIAEATKEVERRFKEIMPDATIKLTINRTFTVIGEISSGVYPIYKEKMTIYQALAMTGDIMKTGDRKNVKIIRETKEGTQVLNFDIRPASLIKSEYYYIYPNDIIYIRKAPSSFFKVANVSSFLGLITSTINLFITVYTYTIYTNQSK